MKGYKPEDGFVVVVKIFTLLGMWPASIKLPALRSIYTILGCCFHLSYNIALVMPLFLNLYFNRHDLHKLIDGSFLAVTFIVYNVKLLVIFVRRKKIEELFHRLNSLIFRPHNLQHLTIFKRYSNIAKLNSVAFITMCWSCLIWWCTIPMLDVKQGNSLVFDAWYPFNATIQPYYTYTYIFQTVIFFLTAGVNTMIDSLVTSFYITMMGQIDILKLDFQDLANIMRNNSFEKSQHNNSFEKSQYNEKQLEYSNVKNCTIEIYKMRIANYVERHTAILTYIHDVTKIFETGIMVQLFGSCVVICCTNFELSMASQVVNKLTRLMHPTSIKFYVIVQYQICVLFQIFIYTFRGNGISVKMSELLNAVYECSWTSVPNKGFRQLLCIIMSRLQIPVTVRVWNFFILSINTFISVLKSSYSFYVLLKQMQTKQLNNS